MTPGSPLATLICHATGSETNPYVQITVSNNALPAHSRHHGGRDLIPAPEDGCPLGEKPDDCEKSDDCEKHHGKKHHGKKHHGKKHDSKKDDSKTDDDGKKDDDH